MFGVKARFGGENFVVSNGAPRVRLPLPVRWEAQMLFNGLLVAKLVADAPNGQHHLRVLRIVFDLCSQAINV